MKLGKSGLTIREIQVYYKPEFELTPRKVANWVKNLPMANVGDSSQRVYRLLVDINQAILDPDKRLSILNTIGPVASKLITSLEKQFINNRIALTEKQKKVAALLQAIQTELSIGYHSVIESYYGEVDLKRSQRKQMATALVLAIKFHGHVILRCYQLYASIPKRVWRELYCLYQIARNLELNEQKVSISAFDIDLSVNDIFTQILLMSVASPYQLRQREIDMLWQIIPELVASVTLKSHAYNKHHYVIALNGSQPPVHKSLYKSTENDITLKLTAFDAVDKLNLMLADIHEVNQASSRKIMLIKHLIQCWNQGAHRAFARTGCQGSANISFGLGATHYHLKMVTEEDNKPQNNTRTTLDAMEGSLKNATLTEVAVAKDTAKKQTFDYLSSSGAPSKDVWEKLYQTEKEKEYEAAREKMYQSSHRSRDTILRDSYKSQEVKLLNMSPNGYCIEIKSEELPSHAQTGEVLGFLEETHEADEHWNIGVVRWVKRQPKGSHVQMGVQLLAPGAKPVDIQLRNSRGSANEFQRALLLPALTGVGQPATMLTNSLSFTLNSKVRIHDKDEKYDARLSKEVAATSSYRQFHFERIGGSERAAQQKNSPQSPLGPDDLDGVWDLV
ncbi:hypothetical protein FLL45_16395 [Aliikangiella marina]|uniref:PilZ domain-containing protein n=1 Tax=Aliikangiella marina TaxID=1712262 RepID=A0A545T743_9GAMM|nr:hypothetical protein [Aliikangiella marina]TQV73040.1 hypothetical protein FLL45_16395 [Aliikangiella marina]